jgi:hypothetical protein
VDSNLNRAIGVKQVFPMTTRPRIEAFKVQGYAFDLVPSAPLRKWMDAFPDRHPYRCLPLSIANTHGWDILCPAATEVTWNGGWQISDLTVKALEPLPGNIPLDHFARSNFSRGIVTFHTSFLFRTPPGWNIFTSGSFNEPKPGIYPLTGIVESDWLPYPFTMNWQMLNPGTVRFEKGEPICTVMPIPKDYLEEWDMVIHDMSDDPILAAEQQSFREERDQFMKRLNAKDPEAIKQAWQRHYFVGRHPDGTKVDNHTNKVRLADVQDKCGTKPIYAKAQASSEIATKILIEKQGAGQQGGCPFVAATPTAEVAAAKPDVPALWSTTSILNDIDQTQGERNFAGRKRLDKGVLTKSKNTIVLTSSIDPSALDFVCEPGFLTPDQCKTLLETAKTLADKQRVTGIEDPYWQGRILFFDDIAKALPEAAEIMRKAQIRVTEKLQTFYELTAPVYADTVQLVQWREGMFMAPHADRANPDGSPHGMPYRDFASIIYLNDDFDGGEFYFNGVDMLIKPKAGTLVAFTGGWHHEHAVLKVNKGLRVTMPAFYTFDATKKDKTVYR